MWFHLYDIQEKAKQQNLWAVPEAGVEERVWLQEHTF